MVKAYHYTNEEAYAGMQECGALVPRKPLIDRVLLGLPKEAYEKTVSALFEAKPDSWVRNSAYSYVWEDLYEHLTFNNLSSKMILLEFDLLTSDQAFVLDTKHYIDGLSKKNPEDKFNDLERYVNSRVPLFEYDGSHALSEIQILNPIGFERLNLVWMKSPRSFRRSFLGFRMNFGFPKIIDKLILERAVLSD